MNTGLKLLPGGFLDARNSGHVERLVLAVDRRRHSGRLHLVARIVHQEVEELLKLLSPEERTNFRWIEKAKVVERSKNRSINSQIASVTP